MQLRKLLRILNNIKNEHGDRVKISVQTKDFQNSIYDYHYIDSVGISFCHEEDDNGWLKDNETKVISFGLESPNSKEHK